MTSYVIDSWAWIEYLKGSKEGEKVSRFIEQEGDVYTSAASLAEVVSKARRSGDDTATVSERIVSLSRVLPIDADHAVLAGVLHADAKKRSPNLSLGDAFALEAARRVSGTLITGDQDFHGIRGVEIV